VYGASDLSVVYQGFSQAPSLVIAVIGGTDPANQPIQ
jgi:hypothetical protein